MNASEDDSLNGHHPSNRVNCRMLTLCMDCPPFRPVAGQQARGARLVGTDDLMGTHIDSHQGRGGESQRVSTRRSGLELAGLARGTALARDLASNHSMMCVNA